MDKHNAVIANMCDGCANRTRTLGGYDICELHPNTLELPCVIANLQCPDYTKE